MQIKVNKTKMYSLLKNVCKKYLVYKSSNYHFCSIKNCFYLSCNKFIIGNDFNFIMLIDEEILSIFVIKKENGNLVDYFLINYQEEYHYFKLLSGLKIITL